MGGVIKIRLWGLPDDLEQAIKEMWDIFNVLQTSEPYPDRGSSKYVRVYMDITKRG